MIMPQIRRPPSLSVENPAAASQTVSETLQQILDNHNLPAAGETVSLAELLVATQPADRDAEVCRRHYGTAPVATAIAPAVINGNNQAADALAWLAFRATS